MYGPTTGVVTGGQQNATSCFPLPYEMTGSRSAQDTILANKHLLNAIGSTNFGNLLDSLGVVITAVATDDEV